MVDSKGNRYVRLPVDIPAEVFLLIGENQDRLSLESGDFSEYIALLIKDDLTDERGALIKELRALDREITLEQERLLELQHRRSILSARFQDVVSRSARSLERTTARLEEARKDA